MAAVNRKSRFSIVSLARLTNFSPWYAVTLTVGNRRFPAQHGQFACLMRIIRRVARAAYCAGACAAANASALYGPICAVLLGAHPASRRGGDALAAKPVAGQHHRLCRCRDRAVRCRCFPPAVSAVRRRSAAGGGWRSAPATGKATSAGQIIHCLILRKTGKKSRCFCICSF